MPSDLDTRSRSQIYGHRSIGHDREAAELVAGLIRRRLDDAPEAG